MNKVQVAWGVALESIREWTCRERVPSGTTATAEGMRGASVQPRLLQGSANVVRSSQGSRAAIPAMIRRPISS